MQSQVPHLGSQLPSVVTRRSFLSTAACAAAGAALPAMAADTAPPAQRPLLLYVGTYSSQQGPEGSRGNGHGIYLMEMDPARGTLVQRAVFANGDNPSWLALNPARTRLYSGNETNNFKGAASGSVSAYAIDRGSGQLSLMNTVSSEGAGPAHIGVHPAGKHVLVANYAGGTVAVLPLDDDGALRKASDVKSGQGRVGASKPSSGPKGSFAMSGHESPHAHMIAADPSGRFVLFSDLARDRIFIWKFDVDHGRLLDHDPSHIELPTGDGPRHFAFHPNVRWFYSLQEEASTIAVFDYDAQRGRFTHQQTISTLPDGFAGTNFTSEIVVTADGRFVYAANRLHDSIARFSVGGDGHLTRLGETWTRGDYPRSFTIDPSGKFLFSCNQRSDAICAFRRDPASGELSFTGQYTPIGTPAMIVFLA